METWLIPVTIVEYGRSVRVEAKTRQEAIEALRARNWLECTDATDFKVTKIGPCEQERSPVK